MKTYTQRRNTNLSCVIAEGDHNEEPDPYAFNEGDEEFSFKEKRDKAGADRDGSKKHKVGVFTIPVGFDCFHKQFHVSLKTWFSATVNG